MVKNDSPPARRLSHSGGAECHSDGGKVKEVCRFSRFTIDKTL